MVMSTAPYMSPEQVRGNPHNPEWCYLPFFYNHYRKGEYEAALQALKKINMPEDPWPQMGIAATRGQLNQRDLARDSMPPPIESSPNVDG